MRQSLSWIDSEGVQAGLRDLGFVPASHPLADLAQPLKVPSQGYSQDQSVGPVSQDDLSFVTGPLPERLEGFTRWVAMELESTDVFVVGQQGLCLAPVEVSPPLRVASTWVLDVWKRFEKMLAHAVAGTCTFAASGEGNLLVLVEHGAWGPWGIGAVVSALPTPERLARVRHAFVRVISALERA